MAKYRPPFLVVIIFIVLAVPTATIAQASNKPTLPKLKASTVYAPELNIPANARIRFIEGRKAYDASRYEEAVEHFKAAGRLYPKYSLAYSALAMSLLQLHRFDECHKAIDIALSLNRNSTDAVIALGALYFYESKFPESEIQLQRVAVVLPHEPRARLLLGGIAMLRSSYDEVIKHTDAIEAKDSVRYPSAFLLRGEAFEKMGFAREAVECYESYLRSAGKGRKNLEQARAAIQRLTASVDEPRAEPSN